VGVERRGTALLDDDDAAGCTTHNVTFGPRRRAAPSVPSKTRRAGIGARREQEGTVMGRYAEVIDELKEPTRSLRSRAPEAWTGFAELHRAAVSDGVVPAHMKELVALAIAVAKECDGCIAYHAHAAARLGATESEVAEVLSVALLMGGGPASVWAPRAWDAYREFAARHAATTN
jgi:AhpD family alkylhydroperoxidase